MNLEGRKAGKELRDAALTDRVISAAITVHRTLGPGFLESIHEEAIALEFDAQGIRYIRQKPLAVLYRGKLVGEHRLDFLVEDTLVLELKAIKGLEDVHFAIVRSYMKACGVQSGMILNFAATPLLIRRVGREPSNRDETGNS